MANIQINRSVQRRHNRIVLFCRAAAIALAVSMLAPSPTMAQAPSGTEDEIEDPWDPQGGEEAEAEDDWDDTSEGGTAETMDGVLVPPQSQSNCSGKVPVVVASDERSQSDIYSAVTLAAVVGSDCIVLAGPRDADMPSGQLGRLTRAQPGGWIVGGTAAVPPAKTAGRSMMRIAGTNRWHTARLVGAVALDPIADIASLHAEVSAQNPLNDEADCLGSEAIVVASDEAAASDIYSAVTLSGVLGTDCIIFAGARDATMPNDQRMLLLSARSGGWIVGGMAAVPPTKTVGRSMTRIAGVDRWDTARIVGVVAVDPDGFLAP